LHVGLHCGVVGSGLAAHDTCTPAKAKEWIGCEQESMGDNRAMVVKVCRGSGAHLDRLVESELLLKSGKGKG
jgi:hypothetical protein